MEASPFDPKELIVVLQDVVAASESALRSLGFRVRERSGDTWELLLPNARPASRTLRGDRGRITLSEARKRGDRAGAARSMLVAPSASPGVIDAALLGRWDLLLWAGPRAIINGVSYEAIGAGPPVDAPRRRDRSDYREDAAASPAGPAQAPGVPPEPSAAGSASAAGAGSSSGAGSAIGAGAASGTGATERAEPSDASPAQARRAGTQPPASGLHPVPRAQHGGGRSAWTRWALARVLLVRGPHAVAPLASRLGVSRQAVSRALNQWGGLVERGGDGEWRAHSVPELRDAWRQAYPGMGGRVEGWRHPLPLVEQTRAASMTARRAGADPLVAGPVAAALHGEELGVPGASVLLVHAPVELAVAGFVRVPLAEATLLSIAPRDPTPWATSAPATLAGEPVSIVDPLLAGLDPLAPSPN